MVLGAKLSNYCQTKLLFVLNFFLHVQCHAHQGEVVVRIGTGTVLLYRVWEFIVMGDLNNAYSHLFAALNSRYFLSTLSKSAGLKNIIPALQSLNSRWRGFAN